VIEVPGHRRLAAVKHVLQQRCISLAEGGMVFMWVDKSREVFL
jgi:hypothetical protein